MRLLPKVRGYRYAMMHHRSTPIIPGIDAFASRDPRDNDAMMHRSLEIIERGDIVHDLNYLWIQPQTGDACNDLIVIDDFATSTA